MFVRNKRAKNVDEIDLFIELKTGEAVLLDLYSQTRL